MKIDVSSYLVAVSGKHMDRRIKFRHLDAFSAIARSGSLKRAADHLNLTQPAISKTLKELEFIVGTILLERSRSGVRLTPGGEVFLQFAEQSTAALRHGLRSLQAGSSAAGHLRVGALPSIVSRRLPRAALDFASQNPDTLLEIYEGPHHDLTARLRSGGIDLVVGRLGRPDSMQGLSFRQLYTEEVVVVTAPGGPAADVREFSELEQFRVLYPPKDTAIRPLVARLLIAQGIPLFTNRIESASAAFGRAVTLSDPATVWFISQGVVAKDLAEGTLVRLDLDTRATIGAVGIMTRSEEVPTAAMRSFVGLLARFADDEARN
jgi:LysR family transcriptional regulator, pca operon transcriptional activator